MSLGSQRRGRVLGWALAAALAAGGISCLIQQPKQYQVLFSDAGCLEYTPDGGAPITCDLLIDCDQSPCTLDADCAQRPSCAELLNCSVPRGHLCLGTSCLGVYETATAQPCTAGACPDGQTCDRGYCITPLDQTCPVVDAGPRRDAGADAGLADAGSPDGG